MLKIKDIGISFDEVLLERTSIDIPEHAVTLIRGVSGCGKTSLLYRIGLISSDQSFEYVIHESSLNAYAEKEKSSFRRQHMAFVLQDSSLYEQYDVIGNMKLYAHISHKSYTGRQYKRFLEAVHLNVPMNQSVLTLSGGERQRLAIACALCKDTEIILLDEPTAFLDEANEKNIFKVIREIADIYHKTIIITSHSVNALAAADEIYEMRDCQLYEVRHYEENAFSSYEQEENGLPRRFIKEYVDYFYKKYRRFERVITALVMVLILLLNGLLVFSEYSADQSIKGYQSLSENQLFVTKNRENITVDSDLELFGLSECPEGTVSEPYIPVKAVINGIPYTAVPYYENNDLSNDTVMHYNQDDLIYISAKVNEDLQDAQVNPEKQCVVLVVTGTDGNVFVSDEYAISGNLKKGSHTPYIEEMNAGFVYVDHKMIQSFYEEAGVSGRDEYPGYTVIADDFENYEKACDTLDEAGYGVNRFFDYIDEIHELEKISRNARNLMFSSGTILILTVVTITEVMHSRKRDREMMLLKLNGLNALQMTRVIYEEMKRQFVTAFAVNAAVLGLVHVLMDVNGMQYILLDAVLLGIVFIVTMVVQYVHCRRMSVESILRSIQN